MSGDDLGGLKKSVSKLRDPQWTGRLGASENEILDSPKTIHGP